MPLFVSGWVWEVFSWLEWISRGWWRGKRRKNQSHKALWKFKFMNAWKKCSLARLWVCKSVWLSLWKWGFADTQQPGMGSSAPIWCSALKCQAGSKPRGDISMEWLNSNPGVFVWGVPQPQAARWDQQPTVLSLKIHQVSLPPWLFCSPGQKITP